MSNLAKAGGADPILGRATITVVTSANPDGRLLKVARELVQRDPALKQLFVSAKESGDVQELASSLTRALEEYFEEPSGEVARYLADEYFQVGDAPLLIDPDSGRPIVKITEKDVYIPAPVTREDGSIVQLGPRLNPQFEAALVQRTFDRAAEDKVAGGLLAKLPQTELLRELGDQRVLFATRQGRRSLLGLVQDALPGLLEEPLGTAGPLLRHVVRGRPEGLAESCAVVIPGAEARTKLPIGDKQSKNLRHDVLRTTLAAIASGWSRVIGAKIVDKALSEAANVTKGLQGAPLERGLWLASPNVAIVLQRQNSLAEVLPVEVDTEVAVHLDGVVGALEGEGWGATDREVFDRWEVLAKASFTVWVDMSKVRVFLPDPSEVSGLSFEIL